MYKLLLLMICLTLVSGCDKDSSNKTKIDKAKIVITETFNLDEEPTFDEDKIVVNDNVVSLDILSVNDDGVIESETIIVILNDT